jgi:hypothetical protein
VKGKPVNQVLIQEHSRPGQNMNGREMKIYKPQVREEQNNNRKPSPGRVEELNKVKPVSERYKVKPNRNATSPAPRENQNNGKPKKPIKKKGNN